MLNILLPKQNCKPSDCEDGLSLNLSASRFCVTDGASESFDSRTWARHLAASWKLSQVGTLFDAKSFIDKVFSLSLRWKKKWNEKELPWYAEEKSKKGAYAAFLGIELENSNNVLRWKGIAVGDCCFFDKVKISFIHSH